MNPASQSTLWQWGDQFSRRLFLRKCTACVAYSTLFPALTLPSYWIEPSLLPKQKARVRLVFSHISPDRPTWPNIGYDYEGRKKEILAALTQKCPDVELLPITVGSAEEAKKLIAEEKDLDGYVAYMIGIWTGAPAEIAASGKPTLFVDDLYAGSGEFLVHYARALREGRKVAGISSSSMDDVARGIRSFACIRKMRSSLVLDITENEGFWGDPVAIKETWGTEVKKIGSAEINQAFQRADAGKAEEWAATWIRNAERVIEPTREEISKSARMYVAMNDLLHTYQAQALTIDCLTLFYGGKLPGYPCLGLFQFNNDGLVGACEGDLPSTLTMLLMTYLVGQPGFISDPVIDTSKNQIIYAHCVASNKVYGPTGPSNAYHIRNHSEDRQGAAIRSLMPLGELTTTIQFNPISKEVVLHQGVAVENVDEDKACRTKLAVEVKGDIKKLFTEWDRWGWHRVTYYGDLKNQVETLGALMGFKVVYEA